MNVRLVSVSGTLSSLTQDWLLSSSASVSTIWPRLLVPIR